MSYIGSWEPFGERLFVPRQRPFQNYACIELFPKGSWMPVRRPAPLSPLMGSSGAAITVAGWLQTIPISFASSGAGQADMSLLSPQTAAKGPIPVLLPHNRRGTNLPAASTPPGGRIACRNQRPARVREAGRQIMDIHCNPSKQPDGWDD